MTWWAIAANAGLSGLQSGAKYSGAKLNYKAKKQAQERHNKMTRISDGINQNAITQNEVLTMQSSARHSVNIKKASLIQEGQAETFAAAAGVEGRSVNQTMMNIQRGAATAERDRQTQLQNQFLAFDQQRTNSAFSAELNQDYSFIPKPKASSFLLGAVTSAFKSSMSQGLFADLPDFGSTPGLGNGLGSPAEGLAGTSYIL